jgi:hypothetical protein
VLIEFVAHAFFGLIGLAFSALPAWDIPPIDAGPAVGLAMGLNSGLPIQEVLAMVGLVIAVDIGIWAFDSFDWLYKHIPFI